MASDHDQKLRDIANRIRILSIESTNAAGSGHPTSCASIAEVLSVLFFDTMKYTVAEPKSEHSDRFVLSKGHAAPALYAAWVVAGLIPVSELMKLRKVDNDLEGHPTPRLNFIDAATGSLGQGLGIAAGMAYVGKYIDKASYRVYCLLGDGESAEGSVWEALHAASYYKLDNLVAIFDVNRLGQSDPTSLGHHVDIYKARLESFGFHVICVDGHDVPALIAAFKDASATKDKPTALVCKTLKGKGILGIEDLLDWHGKPLGAKAADAIAHIQAQIVDPNAFIQPAAPVEDAPQVELQPVKLSEPPSYAAGAKYSVREAYGDALLKLGKSNHRVIGLDADVKNSTFSIKLRKAFPEQHIECFIAEQNLVGMAIGVATRDRCIAFASTFSAFFTRAFDQIRMGAISLTNAKFVGSHVGVSIGEDGPSQMALEDIAMFRSVPTCTVFYPTDAVSCERAVELAANTSNMCFIRTSRPALPMIYSNDETFAIGSAKIVRQSESDSVTIIGAGVTLYEAIKAADTLLASGVHARIIDPFTIKPLDAATIVSSAHATGGRVVVVEDHYPQGGIGEAVMAALAQERNVVVKHLAVSAIPRSGLPHELMSLFGIDAEHIVKAVHEVLKL